MCNRYFQGTNYSEVTNCANFGTQPDKWPDPIWTGAAAVAIDGGLFRVNWAGYQYFSWDPVPYVHKITHQRFNTDWFNLNESGSIGWKPISGQMGLIPILWDRPVSYEYHREQVTCQGLQIEPIWTGAAALDGGLFQANWAGTVWGRDTPRTSSFAAFVPVHTLHTLHACTICWICRPYTLFTFCTLIHILYTFHTLLNLWTFHWWTLCRHF